MARVVSRRKAPTEGAYGIKFTEIIVILMLLLAVAGGVQYWFKYQKSPSAALQNYFAAVKAGNVQAQYDLLDEQDKADFMPAKRDYSQKFVQAHGYTERVTTVTIEPVPVAPEATTVTLDATVDILANSTGKELYQAGSTKGYKDKYVMRKDKEGAWKLVLSKSGDGHGVLNLKDAQPTPDSQF